MTVLCCISILFSKILPHCVFTHSVQSPFFPKLPNGGSFHHLNQITRWFFSLNVSKFTFVWQSMNLSRFSSIFCPIRFVPFHLFVSFPHFQSLFHPFLVYLKTYFYIKSFVFLTLICDFSFGIFYIFSVLQKLSNIYMTLIPLCFVFHCG